MPFLIFRWLHLPPAAARRRPADWLFSADDRVPAGALWLLVGQHAATAMAFVTYVLATAQIAGLDRQGTQSMVAMSCPMMRPLIPIRSINSSERLFLWPC